MMTQEQTTLVLCLTLFPQKECINLLLNMNSQETRMGILGLQIVLLILIKILLKTAIRVVNVGLIIILDKNGCKAHILLMVLLTPQVTL